MSRLCRRWIAASLLAFATLLPTAIALHAQRPAGPQAFLAGATLLKLPGAADSNSPAVWSLVDGRLLLHVVTSFAGWPSRAEGLQLTRMGAAAPVSIEGASGGIWMESVIAAEDGTWYGYYHNELVADRCAGSTKMIPRLGAARSTDLGATWTNLGTILEAPGFAVDCETNNAYFAGGVGDFSVVLDADRQYVYFFYSQYPSFEDNQGVGVGRLLWAARDEPVGRMMVWTRGVWLPSRSMRVRADDGSFTRRWTYPLADPIYPAAESWHDEDRVVDAFWGPSVHWNTHLERYVMLLNRARDVQWKQEGIYVAYADRLDDPTRWSAPVKLLSGGSWYPQVMGLESGIGSDKVAGATARFFMNGESRYVIRFEK